MAPFELTRFVERHQGALSGVFGEVVGLCARAGLVGLNVVVVDGSKIAANASREANVDDERPAREVIEDARATDAEEDERFGAPTTPRTTAAGSSDPPHQPRELQRTYATAPDERVLLGVRAPAVVVVPGVREVRKSAVWRVGIGR